MSGGASMGQEIADYLSDCEAFEITPDPEQIMRIVRGAVEVAA